MKTLGTTLMNACLYYRFPDQNRIRVHFTISFCINTQPANNEYHSGNSKRAMSVL